MPGAATTDFGRGLYGATEIARFVAVDIGADEARRAQHYLREVVSHDDHVPGRPDYSFQDLISVFAVARLHEKGVPLRRIRAAQDCLAELTGASRPFAFQGLWTDGHAVFADLGEHGQLTNLNGTGTPANGQEVSSQAIKIRLESVSFREGSSFGARPAETWEPAPGVEVDPEVLFGTPCVAGTRIPTSIVATWTERGMTVGEIAAEYELREELVQQALAFERRLEGPIAA